MAPFRPALAPLALNWTNSPAFRALSIFLSLIAVFPSPATAEFPSRSRSPPAASLPHSFC